MYIHALKNVVRDTILCPCRKTMLNVGYKLEDYCKEVRYRHQKNLNFTEPIEDIA